MACLAENSYEGMSVDHIAVSENIPKQFLAKIFQKLKKKKLLKSERGRNGGFNLTRPANKIFLLDILNALGADLSLNDCRGCSMKSSKRRNCVLKDVWADAQKDLEKRFSKVKLSELIS